jgi:hypothetical protein
MKKIIILSLFTMVVSWLYAKDISVRIINNNDVSLTVLYGIITNKDNAFSDDELVQKRTELKIASIGKALAPNKKTSFSKTDISGSSIVIVFGMYQGGGRTNIFRYRVKDIEGELEIIFEKVKTIKANSSLIKIAQGLKTTEDLGHFYSTTSNVQMAGCFIYYDISSDKVVDVYVAKPPEKIDLEISKKTDNKAYDLLLKTAIPPFMNVKGDIVSNIPANATETYTEVFIPGTDKQAELFGDNPVKFLTWSCTGSMTTTVKYKDNSYMPLYGSCNETDRNNIIQKFLKDLSSTGSSEYHLYFITSVHQTDILEILDNGMKKLEDYEQIIDNDLLTPNGNFRLDGNEKSVYKAINLINDVKAIDITPLLYYRSILQGRYSNTLESASNCVDVYKELSSFVELPTLDENTMSITSPAQTIAKIKEALSDPKILESIESKLHSITPFSISLTAVKLAQDKLGKK